MLLKNKYEIVDAHGHFGQLNLFHIPYDSPEALIKNMDDVGVLRLCISSFISLQVDSQYGNKEVFDVIKRYPERFLGYATVSPYMSAKEMVEELNRCFYEYGFSAIKLHPYFNGKAVEDEAFLPVYEYAHEHHLTILIHYGIQSRYVEEIVQRYPNLSIILAHFGGAWDGVSEEPILQLVDQYPQIYTDTASSIFYFKSIENLVKHVDVNKIIFGSDMPFLNLAGQVGRITKADMDDESKQKILAGNFKSLIRKKKINGDIKSNPERGDLNAMD